MKKGVWYSHGQLYVHSPSLDESRSTSDGLPRLVWSSKDNRSHAIGPSRNFVDFNVAVIYFAVPAEDRPQRIDSSLIVQPLR